MQPLFGSTSKTARLASAAIALGVVTGVLFYPYLYAQSIHIAGMASLVFRDVTDQAQIKRHHSSANWLGTFSVSVVDFDNDGHPDILSNNHERNRPYFYRNNGDGTFTEMHEALGILENAIGPVFGKPHIPPDKAGFFLWLDPSVAINGVWHLRWQNQVQASVSGELKTNSHIAGAQGVAVSSGDHIIVGDNSLKFDAHADGTPRGIDFTSSFPESTIDFTLLVNGKPDPTHIFIGPRSVNPSSVPFNLSLGDRHATVWGDYNNDGEVDLFITQGAMVGKLKPPNDSKHEELFKNVGGHFVNVTSRSEIRNAYGRGRDAQWVDYDNDGLLDLYVSNIGSPNLLFRNRGDGTFDEVGSQSGLAFVDRTHFVWADFNGDGRPDLFTTNPAGLFLNKSKGSFVDVTHQEGLDAPRQYENIKDAYFWGSGASVADFDNDGDLDVFVAGGKGGDRSTLLEYRDGRLVEVTERAGLAWVYNVVDTIWGDFDNDGHTDLYTIGTDPKSNRLFRNNGNGTFSDVTDAKGVRLWNRFDWDLAGHSGWAATWLDYDVDGFLDLFLATRRPKGVQDQDTFATGHGAPTLAWKLAAWAHRAMKGKIAGTHFLLRNTGNGNHWIGIRLVGTKSNHDGFGAKVYVLTGGFAQYRESGADGKMRFAQNNALLHFGLGKSNRIDEIRIIWPSGTTQVLKGVGVDRVEEIHEPSE